MVRLVAASVLCGISKCLTFEIPIVKRISALPAAKNLITVAVAPVAVMETAL
jgi:hypothetical protein